MAEFISLKNGAGFKCSACGARVRNSDVVRGTHKFCYACGEKMKDNTMFYPQVEGITPTVIHAQEDNT